MPHRWWVLSLFLAAAAGALGLAQSGDSEPRFSVASIHECTGKEPHAMISFSPGRLHLPCWQLRGTIRDAYQVFADGRADFLMLPPWITEIEGFPGGLSSNTYSYTIDARTESPQSIGMMRGPLMQRLLEERFHLKIHREIREGPAYLMTVAKDGPKLKAARGSCNAADAGMAPFPDFNAKPPCGVFTMPVIKGAHAVLDEPGISLANFARILRIGGIPVIDRTDISGIFDIHLEWELLTPDASSPDYGDPPDTTLVSSLRKQLGLQLTVGKGPREFVVIDHLEKPSEN